MKQSEFIVGIDLGTTHCVLAYAEASPQGSGERPSIRVLPIPQISGPGEIAESPLLPSFLFLPGPHDVPAEAIRLPWQSNPDVVVGEFARSRGAEIPNRLVFSAKSWLCHSGVDRTARILPWESPPDAERISPVEATSRLLEHLREAWRHAMGVPLEEQIVYVTVPASFDAVARELTVRAARDAGLENFTLLEEPQAAFYSWLEVQGDGWRKAVRPGDLFLVCDVGGGTTDFSLIRVEDEGGELALRRIAVGDHILLGGDNMDLSLAYAVRAELMEKGIRLDSWQLRGLTLACRSAKERLLSDSEIRSVPVSVLGRGSSLIRGTIRAEVTRRHVERVLLEGFFPVCGLGDRPDRKVRSGMREMGLCYEEEPEVTKHLAAFLSRQAGADGPSAGPAPFPSAVLFNGGVMKAELFRRRILDVLSKWAGRSVRELPSADLDLAVARGAAYYGLARLGQGIRIRAGAARSYYVGIESSMPAVPGMPAPVKALCVVPFGMEEGSSAQIKDKEFGLIVGEPAVFSLLSSPVRRTDRPGDLIEDWDEQIEQVATMETVLSSGEEGSAEGTAIPVWLESRFTEVGTLELCCVGREEEKRWKLEFNLREIRDPGSDKHKADSRNNE